MNDPRDATKLKKTHPQRKFTWKPYSPASSFTHPKKEMIFFDVPGAYLNTDIPEEKFILLNI